MKTRNPFTAADLGVIPAPDDKQSAKDDTEVAMDKHLSRHSAVPADLATKDVDVVEHAADNDSESERPVADDVQHGVQKIQATLSVWSKRDLILAYVM